MGMSSLFLVPLSGSIVFHASKVRACSATSFRKSSRAILSEDGLWREGILEASWSYFFEMWITICGRKRSWCVCGFLFFFFFWKVICEGEKMFGKILEIVFEVWRKL